MENLFNLISYIKNSDTLSCICEIKKAKVKDLEKIAELIPDTKRQPKEYRDLLSFINCEIAKR